MRTNKNKIIQISLFIVFLIALAAITLTLSYFKADLKSSKVLKAPGFKVKLTAMDNQKVLPGEVVLFDDNNGPRVQNLGKNDIFVRVKLELPYEDKILDEIATVEALNDPSDWKMDDDDLSEEDAARLMEDGIVVSYMDYQKQLKPGETTTKMFDFITIPTELYNYEDDEEYNVSDQTWKCNMEVQVKRNKDDKWISLTEKNN